MSDRRRDIVYLVLMALLWVAAAVAVDPRGDFPVTDDWAYGQSMRVLVEQGRLEYSDWAAPNLVSHLAWAYGFVAAFGFSALVLRISTLTIGLIGGVAVYHLFRLAKAGPSAALLAALVTLFNPLYFSLAFSFMTDTPYAAMQMVAMWAFSAGALKASRTREAAGWAATLVAMLNRQLGLFVAAGLMVEAALRRPPRWRRVLFAAGGLALLVVVQIAFQKGLQVAEVAPANYGRQINSIVGDFLAKPMDTIRQIVVLPLFLLFYGGLLLLPMSLACLPAWWRTVPEDQRRKAFAAIVIAAGGISFAALNSVWTFPMWGDTLNKYNGVGAEIVGTALPPIAITALTILASLGSVLLVVCLGAAVDHWRLHRNQVFDISVFGAATALCLLAAIALVTYRFDRYLIPILPCILLAMSAVAASASSGRRGHLAGFAVAALMGLVSVGAVHDFMAAKRVQWQAYQELRRIAPAGHIDANWVLNGAQNFGKYTTTDDMTHWFERADYVLTIAPRSGYEVIGVYPVERWLPWNQTAPPFLAQRALVRPAPRPDYGAPPEG